MKYRFINDHQHEYPTATMCRVLRVARSGFYEWLHKPLSNRAIEDQRLLALIRESYAASGGIYGSLRVFADLREVGEHCGKHRVARLMREHKIKALRGYKAPRRIVGEAFADCSEPIESRVQRRGAQPGLGDRHHLSSHLAGVAVSGRSH